jgi:hypothetical protein
MHILFTADLTALHLPSRWSFPIPAISFLPSEVNIKALTNPVTGTSNKWLIFLYLSSSFQSLMKPSCEPDNKTNHVIIF